MAAANYHKGELIGKGSFSDVYKGLEKSTGRLVALKAVDLESYNDEIDLVQEELGFMLQLSTPYVVHYITSFMKGTVLWIVMELLEGGSVKSLLENVGAPLPEKVISSILRDILRGLVYLHSEEICHQDVKAANILLDKDGTAKLADVLVAGKLMESTRQKTSVMVSPYWLAPEVIQENTYDEKADIWSLGITAYELATGEPPRSHIHPMRVIFMIPFYDCPPLEGKFSDDFVDFVSCCLKRNASHRPTAKELLDHPFMVNAGTKEDVACLFKKPVVTIKRSESYLSDRFFRINTPILPALTNAPVSWEFDSTNFSLTDNAPENDLDDEGGDLRYNAIMLVLQEWKSEELEACGNKDDKEDFEAEEIENLTLNAIVSVTKKLTIMESFKQGTVARFAEKLFENIRKSDDQNLSSNLTVK